MQEFALFFQIYSLLLVGLKRLIIRDDFIVEEDYCMEKIFLEREALSKKYFLPVV
ncbi:hypothetical protein SUT328_06280 [Streptococcus parasuis]|nr:hypothetical protein SUT380_06330 [Streptococcus parasuis]GIC29612.1 hypothetical protein SUT328_06280 [Streptococcus parasuis]